MEHWSGIVYIGSSDYELNFIRYSTIRTVRESYIIILCILFIISAAYSVPNTIKYPILYYSISTWPNCPSVVASSILPLWLPLHPSPVIIGSELYRAPSATKIEPLQRKTPLAGHCTAQRFATEHPTASPFMHYRDPTWSYPCQPDCSGKRFSSITISEVEREPDRGSKDAYWTRGRSTGGTEGQQQRKYRKASCFPRCMKPERGAGQGCGR